MWNWLSKNIVYFFYYINTIFCFSFPGQRSKEVFIYILLWQYTILEILESDVFWNCIGHSWEFGFSFINYSLWEYYFKESSSVWFNPKMHCFIISDVIYYKVNIISVLFISFNLEIYPKNYLRILKFVLVKHFIFVSLGLLGFFVNLNHILLEFYLMLLYIVYKNLASKN